MTKVAVIIGSKSDEDLRDQIVNFLKGFEVECECRVLSAHRNPKELDEFVKSTWQGLGGVGLK
ncbi:MAG: AIR carboxylase family protein [Thermoproteota archaeon]